MEPFKLVQLQETSVMKMFLTKTANKLASFLTSY